MSNEQTISLYDLEYDALLGLLADRGFSSYHADRLWQTLYRRRLAIAGAKAEMRPDLAAFLDSETRSELPAVALKLDSRDGATRKYLLSLSDGQTVEAVRMRYRDRFTACISTQAGCAMGCTFCATGHMGFIRHLTPGEIVGQVLLVMAELREDAEHLRNIVLMGMGEPLHNYANTMTALRILTHDKGLAFAPRHITLSTVGLPGAIRRLAREPLPVKLAVSLHGATDASRSALVPPARRWPLAELMAACRDYVASRGQRIFFEWTLIAGKNDGEEDAHQVGRLLEGLDAHLNVIPLNPTAGYDAAPSDRDAVRRFQAIVRSYGIPSTVRQRRGIDINAGCGQLRAAADAGTLAHTAHKPPSNA
jgi:23S rRNA (adenine2503-C2)-methyltransferase